MKSFFSIAFSMAALSSCVLPAICVAQAKKIPVAVVHRGTDSVGVGIAFHLKEAIRASQSFVLVDPDPSPTTPRLVLRITSMSVQDQQNVNSALSIAVLYDSRGMPVHGVYLNSIVQLCGRDRIEHCAKSILPEIDTETENLRRSWPELWKTL